MVWLSLMAVLLQADPSTGAPPKGAPARTTAWANVEGVVLTLLEQADVPAREAGVLTRRAVPVGQVVEAGQLLGQIDESDARLRLMKAETELKQAQQFFENDIKVRFARKSADVAQSELQRSLDAVSKFNKSVSQTELDRLQLLADKAILEKEQAQLDLNAAGQERDLKQQDRDLAALSVEHRRLTTPLTGMVVQWKKHVGEWVEPGTPVVRVIRLNRLRAEGFAPAALLTPRHLGADVIFHAAAEMSGQQASARGTLVFVSPEIDPVNGQVRFWAEIENADQSLRPGQLGRVELNLPPSQVASQLERK